VLLSIVRGRAKRFSWDGYHPAKTDWSELVDLTTVVLLGAFIASLALLFIPGDQVGAIFYALGQ